MPHGKRTIGTGVAYNEVGPGVANNEVGWGGVYYIMTIFCNQEMTLQYGCREQMYKKHLISKACL